MCACVCLCVPVCVYVCLCVSIYLYMPLSVLYLSVCSSLSVPLRLRIPVYICDRLYVNILHRPLYAYICFCMNLCAVYICICQCFIYACIFSRCLHMLACVCVCLCCVCLRHPRMILIGWGPLTAARSRGLVGCDDSDPKSFRPPPPSTTL